MSYPTVEIVSQGEEVLTGQIVDTNAAWLSEKLTSMGFKLTRHITVGDRLDDLMAVFTESSKRADVCICTGGLGPTSDDLTSQAVSSAFQRPLVEDAIALRQIQQYFAQRQQQMPEANRKQALLPDGAVRLDNDWGTAPGFALNVNQCYLFCVPGVPYEMRQLFNHRIVSMLEQSFTLQPFQLVVMRTVNIGESDIQQRIQHIEIPDSVTLSYRAGLWENQTKLLFSPQYPTQQINKLVDQCAKAIGNAVFSIDGIGLAGGSLVDVIARLLTQRSSTLSLLETISAGQLTARCCADWVSQSMMINRVDQLTTLYAVRSDQFHHVDGLSEAAISIAKQLCENSQSDYSLVQLWTISAGLKDLDNALVPVVTVIADSCGKTAIREDNLFGPLKKRQVRASVIALDCLRQFLLDDAVRIS